MNISDGTVINSPGLLKTQDQHHTSPITNLTDIAEKPTTPIIQTPRSRKDHHIQFSIQDTIHLPLQQPSEDDINWKDFGVFAFANKYISASDYPPPPATIKRPLRDDEIPLPEDLKEQLASSIQYVTHELDQCFSLSPALAAAVAHVPDDEEEEDISDAAFIRTHAVMEALERGQGIKSKFKRGGSTLLNHTPNAIFRGPYLGTIHLPRPSPRERWEALQAARGADMVIGESEPHTPDQGCRAVVSRCVQTVAPRELVREEDEEQNLPLPALWLGFELTGLASSAVTACLRSVPEVLAAPARARRDKGPPDTLPDSVHVICQSHRSQELFNLRGSDRRRLLAVRVAERLLTYQPQRTSDIYTRLEALSCSDQSQLLRAHLKVLEERRRTMISHHPPTHKARAARAARRGRKKTRTPRAVDPDAMSSFLPKGTRKPEHNGPGPNIKLRPPPDIPEPVRRRRRNRVVERAVRLPHPQPARPDTKRHTVPLPPASLLARGGAHHPLNPPKLTPLQLAARLGYPASELWSIAKRASKSSWPDTWGVPRTLPVVEVRIKGLVSLKHLVARGKLTEEERVAGLAAKGVSFELHGAPLSLDTLSSVLKLSKFE
eukprot:gnl/Dysnectes_brevis/2121_a2465_1033.p1 GENE.gnl/Dysnectes_brevis/2121_a2465_1033~~gnl/Dysnectes_brevis/2121_a2465_1033.p1  ORF type:complete len:606 (-),score=165.91 gnl/Dysnectes_brevis/2121_a2465_1033:66-1883(-)